MDKLFLILSIILLVLGESPKTNKMNTIAQFEQKINSLRTIGY